jgi:hypothetical protein
MLGLGASGDGYLDPLREPGAFLAQAPLRFSDLWLEEALSLPAWHGWGASPWRLVGLDLPGHVRVALAAATLVGAWLWWRAAVRAPGLDPLRWLGLGSLLSLLPALAGQPGPRLLLIPSIGASAIVAGWLAHAVSRTRLGREWRVAAWFVVALGLVLAGVRGVASPAALVSQLVTYSRISDAVRSRWLPPVSGQASEPSAAAQSLATPLDVVVLAAPSTSVPRTFLPELSRVRAGEAQVPRAAGQRWWFLANDTLDFSHEWQRTGPRTFELATHRPKLDPPMVETLWIGCRATPGMSVQARILRIRLLEAAPAGGLRRIAVELDRDLDDPSLWFATWTQGELRRIAPPAVGGTALIE